MPFAATVHDGVLTLTLDTPGSPINIFNHATALQLSDILAAVTPATTRAIVFETAKASSFINGVGLLLAQASQTFEDTERASLPPWTAFRAVRDCPVPTIAVVQGSCFGCGVEFVLHCDYRIATDTCETQFYMTELNDYLFIPLFGSTWNLPEAVGLADAIDLLLWGQRWDGLSAYEHGLVDEVVPHRERALRTQHFVERVLAGTQASRRRGRVRWSAGEDAIMARVRERIAALPPPYQEVYTLGLDLLDNGARQTRTYLEHQREELRHSTASALSPIGKAAYAFFYVRQMASERAVGRGGGEAAPVTLRLDVGNGAARAFADDLRVRALPGTSYVEGGPADFWLVADGNAGSGTRPYALSANGHGRIVNVEVALTASPPAAALYAPTYRAGGRVIELATRADRPGLDADDAARLARTLQRLGFAVARTSPTDTFVSNRLLDAFLLPLARAVERGDDVSLINGALRAAGFVRKPHALLAAVGRGPLARQLAAATGRTPAAVDPLLAALESEHWVDTEPDGTLLDALCLSLLDAAVTIRARREVRDPSITDLLARELLDFPRHQCSLCSWLKRARVGRALAGGAAVHALVDESALETARAFVADGREFYR